jgi:hypothetical protein
MKAAVFSAIFGSHDPLHYAVKQSVPTDFYVLLDAILETQGWKQLVIHPKRESRLEARYYKTHINEFFPDEDYVIWIDGSIRITSPKFVEYMISQAGDTVAMFQHPWRDCIYEEAEESWNMRKYVDQPVRQQVEHYRQMGWPEKAGQVATGIMCWHGGYLRSDHVATFLDAWWTEIKEWSLHDQIAFPVLAQTHGIVVNGCDKHLMDNEYFQVVAGHRMEGYEKITDFDMHDRIAKP